VPLLQISHHTLAIADRADGLCSTESITAQRLFAERKRTAMARKLCLHPKIRKKFNATLDQSTISPYSCLSSPLLLKQGNYSSSLDKVLLVDTTQSIANKQNPKTR